MAPLPVPREDSDEVLDVTTESTPSSNSSSSSSSSSNETTDESVTSIRTPEGKESDLLLIILQDLSLALSSTTTGISKGDAETKSGEEGSKDDVAEVTFNEVVQLETITTDETDNDFANAALTDTVDSESDEFEQDTKEAQEAEREDCGAGQEETEQEDLQQEDDCTEKYEEVTKEIPSVGEDLDFLLLLPSDVTSSTTEPTVITPPSTKKNRNVGETEAKSNEMNFKKNASKLTHEFSLLPNFNAVWKYTDLNLLDHGGDLDKSLAYAESNSMVLPAVQAEDAPQGSSNSSRAKSKASVRVPVHDISKVCSADPTTLVHEKAPTLDAQVLPLLEAAAVDSSAVAYNQEASEKRQIISVKSDSIPTLLPRSSSTRSSKSFGRHALTWNQSMPINNASNDIMESAPVRTVHSHEIVPPSTKKIKSFVMGIKGPLKGHGNDTVGDKDCPNQSDQMKPADVPYGSSVCEETTVEDCLKMTSPPLPDLRESNLSELLLKAAHKQVTNDNKVSEEPSEDTSLDQATRRELRSCASSLAYQDSTAQSIVKLKQRITAWTGSRRKKKGRHPANRSGANAFSFPLKLAVKPLNKPRRRRRKSGIFHSLAGYVRRKPTLPVIAEVPDQRDEETMGLQATTGEEKVNIGMTDVVTSGCPPQNEDPQGDSDEGDNSGLERLDKNYELGAVSSMKGRSDGDSMGAGQASPSPRLNSDATTPHGVAASTGTRDCEKIESQLQTLTEDMRASSMQVPELLIDQPVQAGSLCLHRSESVGGDTRVTRGMKAPAKPLAGTSLEPERGQTMDHLPLLHPTQTLSQDEGVEIGTELTLEMHEDRVDNFTEYSLDESVDVGMTYSGVHEKVNPGYGGQKSGHLFANFLKKTKTKSIDSGKAIFSTCPATEIAEEEEGFCITLKNLSVKDTQETDVQLDSRRLSSRFSPTSMTSRSPKRGKKAVHERIFDFLEKKPTWIDIKGDSSTIAENTRGPNPATRVADKLVAKNMDPGSKRRQRVHRTNEPGNKTFRNNSTEDFHKNRKEYSKSSLEATIAPEHRKEWRGRLGFSRPVILRSRSRAFHSPHESREALPSERADPGSQRDQPIHSDEEGDMQMQLTSALERNQYQLQKQQHENFIPVLAPFNVPPQNIPPTDGLKRWRSVEQKIDASLKKAEVLASHYGEDINYLLQNSIPYVSTESFGGGCPVSESVSDEWRTVERKIDDSLSKVEKLARRLGVTQG